MKNPHENKRNINVDTAKDKTPSELSLAVAKAVKEFDEALPEFVYRFANMRSNAQINVYYNIDTHKLIVKDAKEESNDYFITSLDFDYATFVEIQPFFLADMLKYLNPEQVACVALKQNSYFDNDDYLFYDITAMLERYIEATFPKEFYKYLKHRCDEATKVYLTGVQHKRIVKKIENALALFFIFEKSPFQKEEPDMTLEKPIPDTPYERVIKERDDLVEKFDKLHAFIHSEKSKALSNHAFNLLIDQHVVMEKYIEILDERIACWDDDKDSAEADFKPRTIKRDTKEQH